MLGLWRLELLRLVRTRRWLAMAAVFVVFGFASPLLTRYSQQLLEKAEPGAQVRLPPPTTAAAIGQYSRNAAQLGLLITVVVAAASLCLAARPALAVFYRTRIRRPADLVVPRFAAVAALAAICYTAGGLAAWYETAVLIGSPRAAGMLGGFALTSLYLVFATAVVAAAAGLVRGVLATVGLALAALVCLPILAALRPLARFMPSTLLGAQQDLVAGATTFGHYGWSAATAALGTVACLAFAGWRAASREL